MLATLLAMIAAAAAATPTAPTAATLDADRAGHVTILTAHAEGAQIYECKAGQDGALLWSFREPVASLMVDGGTVGRHYAGPRWALDDGSIVQGRMLSTAPGATSADIALLKLAVVDHKGSGALSAATLVYRVKTHGGVLTGRCATAGMLRPVTYSADYVFAK